MWRMCFSWFPAIIIFRFGFHEKPVKNMCHGQKDFCYLKDPSHSVRTVFNQSGVFIQFFRNIEIDNVMFVQMLNRRDWTEAILFSCIKKHPVFQHFSSGLKKTRIGSGRDGIRRGCDPKAADPVLRHAIGRDGPIACLRTGSVAQRVAARGRDPIWMRTPSANLLCPH